MKAEQWGSPLIQEMYQEEKVCDKRQQQQNNNNNKQNMYVNRCCDLGRQKCD